MKYLSKSPIETRKIASTLIKKLTTKRNSQTVVIALEGELGAGKTTFVKGVARELGIKKNITSPTFVIMKKLEINNLKFESLFHIDAYRLKDHRGLISLGIKEILADPKNIVLIEWSDRVKKILPKKHIKIHLDHINTDERKIEIFE